MSAFKPMLSGKADLAALQFPLLASRKLDGIRAVVRDGRVLSRTLKEIPNQFVQAMLGHERFEGHDGELLVGPMNAPDVYLKTNSAVMSVSGEPDFTFASFDSILHPERPFRERLPLQEFITDRYQVVPLQHTQIHSLEDLLAYQEQVLAEGYEGVMLRDADAPYKCGRSTTREGYLLKLKNYETDEAVVIGVVEALRNDNPATLDALGHTVRSSHAENKVGKNTLGALVVKCIHTGVEFQVGSGFDDELRQTLWDNPPVGRIISYNHFPHGRKTAPRHPTWKGFRDEIDM